MREQNCQGNALMRQYAQQEITYGVQYAVIITHMNLIPPGPFKGDDPGRSSGTIC